MNGLPSGNTLRKGDHLKKANFNNHQILSWVAWLCVSIHDAQGALVDQKQ